ncbi:MAG: hypothetical protein COV33_00235 [Candidatus Zambryskibacteria bacterium CG10_big_fil_rev_8_21_14_0_10_34_34]|uniref:Uncharacterized protein n=1 Tax=Candidatus Zambryskibacteria bacterium CG10_big_fil_rev_8_21_14_0_10_34_34 TaxID=1975114 RepID=A0A2H0R1E1_9BACT|nr:MAG: hypothetical protein COV33_00235 [Candidatus Zambryskibacteria bacterium CG10_big_fil_rev_8_21_14_0_10_34_34]
MLNNRIRLRGKSVANAAADGEIFHLKGSDSVDPNAFASMLARRLGVEVTVIASPNPPPGGVLALVQNIPEGEMDRAQCEFYRYC